MIPATAENVVAVLLAAPERFAQQTIKHCHARGVWSVVLSERNGSLRRMFVAGPGHELWRNDPVSRKGMSVGFHAHHCDISIEGVVGMLLNWTVRESITGAVALNEYVFRSAIRTGGGRFMSTGRTKFFRDVNRVLLAAGSCVEMRAAELHTIFVEKDRCAAWIADESFEWRNYVPYTYSDDDLELLDFSQLYHKATSDDIIALAEIIRGIK